MDGFTRRDTMRLLARTSAAIGLIEAGQMLPGLVGQAQAEQDFTWASTGGSWGEHVESIFVGQGGFAAASKVSPVHSYQLETIATAKIIAANGSPPYDVSDNGDAEVLQMRDAGLLVSYDPALIPNLADVPEAARIGDVYASTNFLLFGLVRDAKQVPTPATSFQVLLDPAYKGRIGVPAFGWYGMYWLHGVNKALGGTEDNMDPGMKFAAAVVKGNNAVTVENADHGRKLFGQGEIVFCPFWNGICNQLARRNLPVKFDAVPGTLAIGTGFVILKGTANAKAAQSFVNLTLDPKLQAEFAAWNLYPPTNRKAVMPAEFADIAVTPAQLANTVKLDWTKVVAHKAEYLKRWNEEVLS